MANPQNQPGFPSGNHTSAAEKRELYRQKYDAQMREWNARIDEIKAHTEKLAADARLDMQPHVDKVHRMNEAARARLRDLSTAADDTWEDVKRNADNAWQEFKAAVEGAYDALKSYRKPDSRRLD
jgi:hypothetical protein